MSLTTLVRKDAEVRAFLASAFPRPKTPAAVPLVVHSTTPRPAEIGSAFDYLFRWYLRRANPGAVERDYWIADRAVQRLNLVNPDLAALASAQVENARQTGNLFVATGKPTVKLLMSAIELGRLDPIYRSARGMELIGAPIHDEFIEELKLLLCSLRPTDWRRQGRCLLNPTFGDASRAVGGADCDVILGNTIIDLKTSKKFEVSSEDYLQIIGYCLLHDIAAKTGSSRSKIDSLAIFYARYACIVSWPKLELGSLSTWNSVTDWFTIRLGL
jgi:hypothetical protein